MSAQRLARLSRAVAPVVELLERRRLLTASLNSSTGVLLINGTDAEDTIRAVQANGEVTITSTPEGLNNTYNVSDVTQIQIFAGDGNDKILIDPSVTIPCFLDGGAGSDSIRGGSGNDSLFGDDGNDTLDGGLGADELVGGVGTDTADYSDRTGDLNISLDNVANDGYAGEGDDCTSSMDIIYLGSGNDTFTSTTVNDIRVVYGGAGNDTITTSGGDDTIYGGDGNDSINGGDNDDYIDGGTGDDTLVGAAGNDTLLGDDGNDTIDGFSGSKAGEADSLSGGAGNDTLLSPGTGKDTLRGGDGIDYASYQNATSRVKATLSTSKGNGIYHGHEGNDFLGSDVEGLIGSSGSDILTGTAGNDIIYGLSGSDSINGGAGNDYLRGASGNDTIIGGAGSDTIFGDNGNDTIYAKDGTRDTIDCGTGTDVLANYDGNGVDLISNYP